MRQASPSLHLRSALSLARLWIAQGKPGVDCSLPAAIYATFCQGFTTASLAQALLQANP